MYIPLINNAGKLVTTDEKAEVLNNSFALVFKWIVISSTFWKDGQQDRDWESKMLPTVSKDQNGRLWGGLIAAFQYKKGVYKKDGQTFYKGM